MRHSTSFNLGAQNQVPICRRAPCRFPVGRGRVRTNAIQFTQIPNPTHWPLTTSYWLLAIPAPEERKLCHRSYSQFRIISPAFSHASPAYFLTTYGVQAFALGRSDSDPSHSRTPCRRAGPSFCSFSGQRLSQSTKVNTPECLISPLAASFSPHLLLGIIITLYLLPFWSFFHSRIIS